MKKFLVVLTIVVSVIGQPRTLTINNTNGRCYYKNLHNYSVEYDSTLSHWNIGDTVRLIPLPNAGYKFAYWVAGEDTFYRGVFDTIITSNTVVNCIFATWTPPVGIPNPPFGIFNSYRMYDNENNRNSSLSYYPSSDGGYYTHYVNPSDPLSTDISNVYGTVSKPRKTLPATTNVPEGSVIELHDSVTISGQLFYNVLGSTAKPIFIRGIGNKPTAKLGGGELNFCGTNVIVENIDRRHENIMIRATTTRLAKNIVVRNCLVFDCSAGSYDEGHYAENIVYYGNYLNANYFDPNMPPNFYPEMDGHGGFSFASRTDTIWFLDNIATRTGSDGISGGHGINYCYASDGNGFLQFIF